MSNLSPKDRLLENSAGVLRWLNTSEGMLFSEWLSYLRARENKKLMESEKQELIFRAQGGVGILDVILALKDDLRQYEKDIADGRVKRIGGVQNAVVR